MKYMMNKFLVGARPNGGVVIGYLPSSPLSPDDAIILAAWLVAIAQPWADRKFEDEFNEITKS